MIRGEGVNILARRARDGGIERGRRGRSQDVVMGVRDGGVGRGRGGVRGMIGTESTSEVHEMIGIKSDDAAPGMGRGSARGDIDDRYP
jgi:hypothetical protein